MGKVISISSRNTKLPGNVKLEIKIEEWKQVLGKQVVGEVLQISESGHVCVKIADDVRGVLRADRCPAGERYQAGERIPFSVVSVGQDYEADKGVLLWLSRLGMTLAKNASENHVKDLSLNQECYCEDSSDDPEESEMD